MSDLTNRALAKLTGECEKKEYLIPFEEYLTGIMTDKVAEKVLEEKKSLQGAFDKMKEVARTRAKNGCACKKSVETMKEKDPEQAAKMENALKTVMQMLLKEVGHADN